MYPEYLLACCELQNFSDSVATRRSQLKCALESVGDWLQLWVISALLFQRTQESILCQSEIFPG